MLLITGVLSCNTPVLTLKTASPNVPAHFDELHATDSTNVATINWRDYFGDANLTALIETALQNNQELNIVLQEIEISRNEVLEKSGEYLPAVNVGVGLGAEKPGRYTRDGAVEHGLEIEPGKEFPEPLGDFKLGAMASWEVDIWRKLRNAKDAAQLRYIAATEGRNFLVTQLIAEIATSYYELMALDNQLQIIDNNVILQTEALRKVELQKQNARATQLAVNRFEAQLLNTQNLQYALKQQRVETENRINFLVGRYPTAITRNAAQFMDMTLDSFQSGIPTALLQNRPDIRQMEYQLAAANIDVKVARADFYPHLEISAGLGIQAFNPVFLFSPESLLFNTAGDLMAPIINRRAIQAKYNMANTTQIQAVFQYEQAVLNAFMDVLNQLNKLDNYAKSWEVKSQEVQLLNDAVETANSLYRSARADYVEVLLTQEEALDAKMELVETKLKQINSKVEIYRALGGGWQ